MSTELKTLVTDIEAALKRDLKEGEKLRHITLGPVVFSDHCAELERRVGHDRTSVHVEHEGDCKEVSLAMLVRTLPDGREIRLQEESPELLETLERAKELLAREDVVMSVAPLVTSLSAKTRKLYA
jgi:hypothetical protein